MYKSSIFVEAGTRFHMLVTLTPARKLEGSDRRWIQCRCDCGTVKELTIHDLRNGRVKSCGCAMPRMVSESKKTHGSSGQRLYEIWQGIRKRCLNPHAQHYASYGGRGIIICPEWETFPPFAGWAKANGYADDLTIERKDVNGGYCPENCCWIPSGEQQNNQRRTHWVTAFGETKNLVQWEHDPRCTVRADTIRERIQGGMTEHQAVALPNRRYGISQRQKTRDANS